MRLDGTRNDAMFAKLTIMGKGLVLVASPLLCQLSFIAMIAFIAQAHRLNEPTFHERLLRLLICGTALAVITTVALAFLFSREISSRLVALAANARRLSQRQELPPPLPGDDEINRVDQAFREMHEQQTRAQEILKKQEQLLQSILESIGDGVIVADERGRFVLSNTAAVRIIGIGATGARPEEWTQTYGVYLPDGVTPFPTTDLPLVRAIRGESSSDVDMFLRNIHQKEGVWISVTGTPLRDRTGAVRGGVVVCRDITERKRAAEAIRHLNGELEERVRERTAQLAQANQELQQKNQENETFVYSVSHDLRSPLVNLEGFAKELSLVSREIRDSLADEHVPSALRERIARLVDGEMAEAIHFIQNNVMRLSQIIDALLRLSRAGRVTYQWQRVDVRETVDRIVASLAATIAQRQATVVINDLPPAWGDPTAIDQIFANLIGNALNYLDANRPGRIEMACLAPHAAGDRKAQARMHTFSVKDNGLGIPQAYQSKIFQAFQRLHPDVAKGEGVGLTLVSRIVERHGGKIWFESKEGVGTTFFVMLPMPVANANPARPEGNAVRVPVAEVCHAS